MPIEGLTDRGLTFPEIGQIRKGGVKGENQPGKDLDHFRVVFDERETEAQTRFTQVYGPTPTEIKIMLPFNQIEQCWDPWLEAYTASRLVARTDGKFYEYLIDTKTGEPIIINGNPRVAYSPGQAVGEYTDLKGRQQPIFAKPAGRLKVVLPVLERLVYLTFMTSSKLDIINITSQLRSIQAINGGNIAGIPLILKRREMMVSRPDKDKPGQRIRQARWMVSIEADPDWVQKKLAKIAFDVLPEVQVLELPNAPERALNSTNPREIETDEDETPDEEMDTQAQPAVLMDHAPTPQLNAEKGSRPYAPAELKSRINDIITNKQGSRATAGDRAIVLAALQSIFRGIPAPLAAIEKTLNYLVGMNSITGIGETTVLALLSWLSPKMVNGKPIVDELAIQEAHKVNSL